MNIAFIAWAMILMPLNTAIFAVPVGRCLGRRASACMAMIGITLAFVCSCLLGISVFAWGEVWQFTSFTWLSSCPITIKVGLLVDPLSTTLMFTVTSVALLVHIYSLSYMAQDKGYDRYFSYLGFFTFSMLTLVGASNSLQLFFGWEAVGLASYLLIGFWFNKEEARRAALKALLMNRVGDIGLLLGLSLLITYTGSAEYGTTFQHLPKLHQSSLTIFGYSLSLANLIGVLLFTGAVSKSAQIPLQLWLPDSMVGPTPVSALMHAATMVTAGIYLVARFAPLFEQAPLARAFILVTGSTTALLLGIVTLVQTNIKRAIAFSTISQLGYMTAGLGVSAYAASILHLVTHAYFKALLFLAAGSVILALDHEQSLSKMGGLCRRLPLTYTCFMIGALALIGLPPFSGFYSKDLILNAVYQATETRSIVSLYAFYSLLAGVLVTALYTGRLIFLIFHGHTRCNNNNLAIKEPDAYITTPLIVLAIPAVGLGWLLAHPLYEWWMRPLLGLASTEVPLVHHTLVPWLSSALTVIGLLVVWSGYTMWPLILTKGPVWGKKLYTILASQYGLEKLHQRAVITIIQRVAKQFATMDTFFIDRLFVQGSTQLVKWVAKWLQPIQSGWLYQYLLIMIMSLILFLLGVVIRA